MATRKLHLRSIARLAIPCSSLALLIAGRAEADNPEGDPPVTAAAPTNATGGIQEVMVTARKRSENAQSVPDSLVVMTPATIQELRINQAGDLGRVVPNIDLQQDLSVTSTFIDIRGITATRNTDPAVALVIDGVQTSNASAIRQELDDVQRIEVLKGPQGSLYGRDAIGGAINVVTNMPTNEPKSQASIGFGNVGAVDASAEFSGAIIPDRLLFRVSAFYHDDDGDIRDPAVGNSTVNFSSDKTGKVRFIYKPSDDLMFDLKYDHDEWKGGAYYFAITRPLGAPYPYADPASNSNTFSFAPMSVPISVDYSTIADTSLRITDDLAFGTLASVTAYSTTDERYGEPGQGIGGSEPGDLDFTPADIEASAQTFNVKSWSEELRLSSRSSGALRWMVGAYYLSVSRYDTLPFYLLNGSANPADWLEFYPLGTHRTIRDYAGFGQLDYDVGRATLTLGVRYDDEHRTQFDMDNPSAGTRRATFALLQPKVSISYHLTGDHMLYVTVSRGFRSGGFNVPRSIFTEVYQPEKLWNYEAGYKGEWADGRLRTNAALFYEDIKNVQEFVFDGVNAAQTIYTIPKARIEGAELELTYRPVSEVLLTANFGAMQSKIQQFAFGPLFPTPLVDADMVGKHLPDFSHWSMQLGADYTRSITTDLTASAHIDYSLRGKLYWDPTNLDVEKNISLLGAELALAKGRYRLSLWGSNLLDTRYWSNWFNQQTTDLPDVGYPAQPRRFGVKVAASF